MWLKPEDDGIRFRKVVVELSKETNHSNSHTNYLKIKQTISAQIRVIRLFEGLDWQWSHALKFALKDKASLKLHWHWTSSQERTRSLKYKKWSVVEKVESKVVFVEPVIGGALASINVLRRKPMTSGQYLRLSSRNTATSLQTSKSWARSKELRTRVDWIR